MLVTNWRASVILSALSSFLFNNDMNNSTHIKSSCPDTPTGVPRLILLYSSFSSIYFSYTSLNINSYSLPALALFYIQNRIFSFLLNNQSLLHPQYLNLLEISWIKLYPQNFVKRSSTMFWAWEYIIHNKHKSQVHSWMFDSSINMKVFEIILGTWIGVNMQLGYLNVIYNTYTEIAFSLTLV